MNFSDRLKQAREEKNFTQGQLADLSGLSGVSISKYERGETAPTINTVFKIEIALGVHRGSLIGLDDGSLSKEDVRKILAETKNDVNMILSDALKKIKKF